MSSSTSSSKTSLLRWVGPGALWCIAFVLVFELLTHLLPHTFLYRFDSDPYKRGMPRNYLAVNLVMETMAPPEILFVGSSRSMRGLVLPEMRAHLEQLLGREVSVRNYAAGKALVDTQAALLDRLAQEGHCPDLLVYVPTASQVFEFGEIESNRAFFLNLQTLPADIRRNGLPTEAEMTDIITNSIPLRLVRMRATMRSRLYAWDWTGATLRDLEAHPALGAIHHRIAEDRQAGDTMTSLVTRPLSDDYIMRFIGGVDRLGTREVRQYRRLFEQAERRGLRLAVVEAPLSPPFRRLLAPNVEVGFRDLTQETAQAHNVPCRTLENEVQLFGPDDFAEQSHLNYRGASEFTALIAPFIAEHIREP